MVFPTKDSPFKGRRTSSWSEVIFSGYKDTKRERERERRRPLARVTHAGLSNVFLRAGRQLYISLRSDWFIGLSKTVVIGQRDKIGLQNVNVII